MEKNKKNEGRMKKKEKNERNNGRLKRNERTKGGSKGTKEQ